MVSAHPRRIQIWAWSWGHCARSELTMRLTCRFELRVWRRDLYYRYSSQVNPAVPAASTLSIRYGKNLLLLLRPVIHQLSLLFVSAQTSCQTSSLFAVIVPFACRGPTYRTFRDPNPSVSCVMMARDFATSTGVLQFNHCAASASLTPRYALACSRASCQPRLVAPSHVSSFAMTESHQLST